MARTNLVTAGDVMNDNSEYVVVRSNIRSLPSQVKAEEKRTVSTENVDLTHLPKVLYPPAKNYLAYREATNDVSVNDSRIDFPLNIDTEFTQPLKWSQPFNNLQGKTLERFKRQCSRLHLTTQMKGIECEEGMIFVARESAKKITRHKTLETGFDPIDYLKALGYNAQLAYADMSRWDKNMKAAFQRYPEFRVVMFAHFATAEMMLIVRGDYWDTFENLVSQPDPKFPPGNPRFELKRHLKAVTDIYVAESDSYISQNYVDLPWTLTLNGRLFRVTVEWVDSCALHGIGSYKAICDSARVTLPYKDNFTSEEKGRMLEMAIKKPVDFDNYALGDLYVYDALVGNAENFRQVYKALGIEGLYKEPRLTIGATVKNLFEAKLCHTLGVNYMVRDEVNYLKDNFLSPISAKVLRENPRLTRALAAKVEGGRCRNNRPTDWRIESPICDIDVSSCYAEGLRFQQYPIGNPIILDLPSDERNHYQTLGEFRKSLGSELIPGLWVARVWSRETLEYPQDFLASWFVPSVGDDLLALGKYIQAMASDTDEQNNTPFELGDGQLKIFTNEVVNAVITHDFLEWLDNIATPRQRKELESKLLIKVAIVYPKSWQIVNDDIQESYRTLVSDSQNHKEKNSVRTTKRKGKLSKINVDGQYHGWFSVNLGELIVDDLLTWRKYYQKTEGKKSPMDLVFKLCCNTLYGDMTSRFFDCANTVVGNNVTARARAMVWYAEKGLHCVQSITDGGCFELNRVVYPNKVDRRVNGENVVGLYTVEDREARVVRQIRYSPLGGCESIEMKWIETEKEGKPVILPTLVLKTDTETVELDSKQSEQWINKTALVHLQSLFPKVSVLHSQSLKLDAVVSENNTPEKQFTERLGLFGFEMKAFFDRGVFHGSANYFIESPSGDVLKMRSYETSKPHDSIDQAESLELDGQTFILTPYISDRYGADNNPGKDFMKGLMSGEPLARQVTFVKDGILKPGDYKAHLDKYRELELVPGDTISKSGLLREFSLSQFTFSTMSQFIAWEKKITRLKEKFGQSIEQYFSLPDRRLDFDRMTRTVDQMIREGNTTPIETLDPAYTEPRLEVKHHPQYGAYVSMRALLGLSEE